MSEPTPVKDESSTASASNSSYKTGLLVLIGALAVLLVGLFAWAYSLNTQVKDLTAQNTALQQQSDATKAQDDASMGALENKLTAEQKALVAQREAFLESKKQAASSYSKLHKKYVVEENDLKTETSELSALHAKYKTAAAAAAADEANLQAQLTSETSKAQLATKCARVLDSGLNNIYADLDSGVTYSEVEAQLREAYVYCADVINMPKP